MAAALSRQGAGFWTAAVIVAATFIATPFILIPWSEGTDGFRGVLIFIGCTVLFGLETLISVIVASILVNRNRRQQIGKGIIAGLVAGLVMGYAVCIVLVRFVVS